MNIQRHDVNGTTVSVGYTVTMTPQEYQAIGACIEQAADTCNAVPDRNDTDRRITLAINLLLREWRAGLL